jgi:glycosyltransferase involved in cell wall biosynthesis
MYKGKRICVIVPAFNESRKIQKTLTTVPIWVDAIIAIDDKSTDTTLEEMRIAQQSDRRISIIELQENSGVGFALRTGYQKSIREGFDVSAVMDGDGQMDPDELWKLLDPICSGEADMAKGNRFFSSNSYHGMPRVRLIGNVFLSLLNKIGSGYWSILDPQNGYIAISNSILNRANLTDFERGYSFQNDFLCKLRLMEARVIDVNIPARYQDEISTLKIFPTSVSIIRTLIKGFLRRVFVMNLLWSFAISSLLFIAATFFGLLAVLFGIWITYTSRGALTQTAGSVTLEAIFLIFSLVLYLAWLILDVSSEPRPRR